MGRDAGCYSQCNTVLSHAAPSRRRRVPSIADNLEAVPEHCFTFQIKNRHHIGRFQFFPLATSMPEATGFFQKVCMEQGLFRHRLSTSYHHPGKTGSHPRVTNPSINVQLQQTGDESGDPSGRYRSARCGNPKPTGSLLIGWGSRFEEPAPPGEDQVPFPDQKSFHTFATPTHCARKRWSRPHWLIAEWLGFVEPAPPGDDKVPSPDYHSMHLQLQ